MGLYTVWLQDESESNASYVNTQDALEAAVSHFERCGNDSASIYVRCLSTKTLLYYTIVNELVPAHFVRSIKTQCRFSDDSEDSH